MTETATRPVRSNLADYETVRVVLDDYAREVLATVPNMAETGYSMSARSEATAWYAEPKPTHRAIASEWTGALLDQPSAVIVYKSRHDETVQVGVARCRRPAGYAGRTENSYEVSPFPGGWEEVRESQILAVRHTHAI